MRHLTFVVMGETFEVDWDEDATLFMLRWHVLQETYNTGRPAEDFVIRDDEGRTLDPWTRVRDLPSGKLWLSPQVGWGGSHRNFRRKDVPPIMNGRLWIGSTMFGRNNTRWDTHAHAHTQSVNRRMEARKERRTLKQNLFKELL